MVGYDGHVFNRSTLRGWPQTLVINSLVSTSHAAADVTSDDNCFYVLSPNVMISSVDTNLTGHLTRRAKAPIDFRTLAARWMISPQQAQKTITVTTQRGVRTCLYQPWLVGTRRMTECSVIHNCHTHFLPIRCSLALPLLEEISVPKYTPHLLAGVEPTQ